MTGNTYALIRVSSKKQNEARQIKRMAELGIAKEHIVIEKESGKSTLRAKYRKLVKQLKAGDTLYIENVDRLILPPDKKQLQKMTRCVIINRVIKNE